MHSLLWEIGQQGGVSGDAFIKVAYEEPQWYPEQPIPGVTPRLLPGRIRIIPLNSSFMFPEWHPHDRSRLLRAKLKYRFFGTSLEGTRQVFCRPASTEILTQRGWLTHADLTTADKALTIDPNTKAITWQPVLSIHRFDFDGELVHWHNSHGFDVLSTSEHRWLTAHRNRAGYSSMDEPGRFMTTEQLSGSNKQIITGGGTPECFADQATYSNQFVELAGWAVTEGHYQKASRCGVLIGQSETANPDKTERIRLLMKHYAAQGATATEHSMRWARASEKYVGSREFYFGLGIGDLLRQEVPDKTLTPDFLCKLTSDQAELLYETILDGDGHRAVLRTYDGYNRTVSTENLIQRADSPLVDGFQMLAGMLGKRSSGKRHSVNKECLNITIYARPFTTTRHLKDERVPYKGVVWCPRTEAGTWLSRENGAIQWTGNTYTELITDTQIEEYVNDELIDRRPNPLGIIPIVHIPNTGVSGSPWGLPDCGQDFISLQREFNEKSLEISDIINYCAAPITVVTGAKIAQLERGPKKVWGGLPKDAKVENLQLDLQGIEFTIKYLEMVKRAMHETTGVPETALGQMQPISNTSGVALSILFAPLMIRHQQKTAQYGEGFEKVNELILRTLALKEPETFAWNPDTETELRDGQLSELDPNDPITYQTYSHFPPPLPLDALVVLNELTMKQQLGLESRRGMLRALGEAFPDEKLTEITEERKEDAILDGALRLIQAQIDAEIMNLTGLVPGANGDASSLPPTQDGPPDAVGNQTPQPQMPEPQAPLQVQDLPQIMADQGEQGIRNKLVTEAYGTKIPKRQATID